MVCGAPGGMAGKSVKAKARHTQSVQTARRALVHVELPDLVPRHQEDTLHHLTTLLGLRTLHTAPSSPRHCDALVSLSTNKRTHARNKKPARVRPWSQEGSRGKRRSSHAHLPTRWHTCTAQMSVAPPHWCNPPPSMRHTLPGAHRTTPPHHTTVRGNQPTPAELHAKSPLAIRRRVEAEYTLPVSPPAQPL